MDSLASPKLVKNWESSSGIISVHASAFPANLMSRAWPRSSSTDAHLPNHLGFDSAALGGMSSAATAATAPLPWLLPQKLIPDTVRQFAVWLAIFGLLVRKPLIAAAHARCNKR